MEILALNYTFLIVLFIFFIGGVVKGTIGVGLPTVTLVLLSFILDIKDSISIILIPVIFTNLIQLLDGRNLRSIFFQTKYFLFSSILFILPGFYLLRILDSKVILMILSLLLVSNSLLVTFNKIIKLKNYNHFYIQFCIGSLTGITTGITSIYTMPFIFLIQSLNFSKDKLIQFMGLTFFLYSSFQLILFSSYGMIDDRILFFSSISCIPIFFGLYAGKCLRKIISEKLFKILFNYMLLGMGFIILIRNIF